MDEFHKQAAILGIKKMFEGRRFSICEVRHAMVITGGRMSAKDEAAMSALHCIDFTDMSKELRQMLFTKVMEVLSGEPIFNTELISAALDDGRAGFHERLLN
ncbi:hypothetical protein [Malikia spinosa]|uniref:hypothetical protein n=1 Tax=Malikia spinosa TaxID=86180 RepID=UPI002FDB3BA6